MSIDQIRDGQFEIQTSVVKQAFYGLERFFGNLLLRKYPPQGAFPRLLNLGCGPLAYEHWINADDYAFKRSLREKGFRPNWRLDIGRPWKCENDYWDGIFTQHVLEHLTYSTAVFVLEECYRTLKPGHWIRISVPSLRKYVDFYEGRNTDGFFKQFPHKALAISFLTQMHFHKSVWDVELIASVLAGVGFHNAREVTFGQGTDIRLVKDQDVKAQESLYVEAQKP